jgi:exonuclease SbcC
VRPISLTMHGLRSWRTETTIDFDDLSLVAIVGPTGAGKSSVLEALTFALYAACTWDGSAVKDLISTGEHTMTVKLVFRAGGGEWTVTRSVSRTSTPPATHLLEGPDEPDGTRNRHDGQQAVTERIEKLLGLRRAEFLQTVVLPQGKFQTLLHASPVDRVKLLTGILGLGVLEAVGERAGDTMHALTARHEELLTRRHLLPVDPVADLAAAEAQVERLEPLVASLGRAKRDHRQALEEASAQLDVVAGAQATAGQIATLLAEDHRAALAETVLALRRLAGELDALAGEELALAHAREPVDLRLARLAENGLRPATVADALSALADAEALPALHESRRTAQEHLDGLAARHETALAAAQRAVAERAATATDAVDDHEAAETDLDAADADHARIAGLAETLADVQADIDARAGELEAARRELVEAQAFEATAGTAVAEATAALTAAEEHRRAALDADGVAVIAHDLHAGDDCPVCDRALPAGWAAPPGGAAAAASAAVDEARVAQASARETQHEAQACVRSLASAVDDLAARLVRLDRRREETVGALVDPAPEPRDAESIERVVEHAAARLARARARETAAREARGAARDALHDEQRALAALHEAHEHERRRAAEDLDRHTTRAGELTERLDRVPAALRPAGTASAADIASARERAERTLDELDQLATAGTALDDTARDLARRRSDVEARRASHHPAIERARSDLRLLQTAIDPDDRAASDAVRDADPRALQLLAERLHAGAAERIAALEAQERAARTSADGHTARAAAILARLAADHPDLPFTSADDVTSALATMKAEHGSWTRARASARDAIPACAALDGEIDRVVARRHACQQVRGLTARSKFPKWLIGRREALLLGIASDILRRLTRERYGFANDFKVVDRDAGQARNPKTLSGGETFLASLALAFALVEMTGRSGARIDCLFLDEGFGSLSAGALDTALDAIGSQAIGDRLIAVISHVPEVADRVETVIEISQTADGNSQHRRRRISIDPRVLLFEEPAAA